jgi:hypothetical protein
MKWRETGENCIMRSFITCTLHHVEGDETRGACSTHGRMRNAYSILLGEHEGKIPFRRPKRRWEDNIRMDIMEIR